MKDYKKYYIIPAPPEDVYRALTIEITLELWTGSPATMIAEPDTEFELWDGSICGRNIAFEQDKKLVQEWYFGEQESPSIVTITLHPHKKGTSAELLHTNIPDEAYEDITAGWDEDYFGALVEFYTEE